MFHKAFHRHGDHRFARGEWFAGRHGGFRHPFRGGGGRLFDHGDLRLVMLQLVAEKPHYGYELIKEIEEKLGGVYSPSPGVVYPTLTMLEELGYATVSASDGGKKLYAITPEGRAFLDANRATVDAIFARIAEVGAAQGGGPAPQLVRAMQNLRLALRMRLARGPLSDEQIHAIVAVLDAATVDVERS
jgi:DNA-binding PadR family transcriptional regulator